MSDRVDSLTFGLECGGDGSDAIDTCECGTCCGLLAVNCRGRHVRGRLLVVVLNLYGLAVVECTSDLDKGCRGT